MGFKYPLEDLAWEFADCTIMRMESNELPPRDWLEMTDDANELLLQSKIEEIRAETEEYRRMLELVKNYPGASAKDVETYETAIRANEWLIERIEKANLDFQKDIEIVEDEA
jgi:hypothetical protein